MILLSLALIAAIFLIGIIYNKLKHEENTLMNFQMIREGMDNSVNTQYKMMDERKGYYGIRSEQPGTGMIVTKPGINKWLKYDQLKEKETGKVIRGGAGQALGKLDKYVPKVTIDASKVDGKVFDCGSLESCDDLNGANCGYCFTTNTFSYGDKNGPKTNSCPKTATGIKAWSMEPGACKKIKERATCGAVKDCGDMMGDSALMCGYCPTTGKIMPKKKQGGKNVPKYAEDKCPGSWGLLNADKCLSFAKDNPCVTPNWEKGPHSEECVKKLFKNSKCTKQPPVGKPYSWWTNLSWHYKKIGNYFLDTFKDTLSNDYEVAKHNNIKCYGNTSRLKSCDNKYMKNSGGLRIHPKECYEKKYKKAGCTEKGDGWKDIQNNLHLEILRGRRKKDLFGTNANNDNYTDKFKKLSENALTSNDYSTKKKAAMECYGEIPPPPPPVKVGDLIAMYVNLENSEVGSNYWMQTKCEFQGIITKEIDSNYCNVMWINIKKRNGSEKLERKTTTMEEQKKYFGWPNIPPNFYADLIPGKIPKSKLKMRKGCLKVKSACKPNCSDIVNNVLFKYPKPRDCIVSQWDNWSNCSRSCGGGTQYKTRDILYHPRRGGQACPELKKTQVCNTQSCTNPNFKQTINIDGTIGRYVRIEGYNQYLHIQELEVYNDSNRNIARGKKYPAVKQSSQGWSGSVNYITDGNKRWKRWPNSNHTHRGGRQWIELDLGGNHRITKIVVYNRPDCCRGRLNNAKMFIMDSSKKIASKKISLTSARTQTYYTTDWQLGTEKPGKFVTLTSSKYGCPAQTFRKTGSYYKGPNRNLMLRGNTFYCCTNTWCSGRRGGWFSRFNKKSNFLKYN